MEAGRRVGAVILAAGESRRYGSPKQLAVVDGATLLEHAIATARTSGLTPVVAVVPVWLSRPARLDGDWLRWIRNPYPERGMSLSLRLGLEALTEDADAAVILLGDQPRVPAETIAALIAARGRRPIVAAEADGLLAPPILVERSHFRLAGEITGDQGLRDVLRAEPQLVQPVSITTHPIDVDTPADLGRIGHMFDSDS
jgi:CTP:molybdopterin cytidylyltransferase MocA